MNQGSSSRSPVEGSAKRHMTPTKFDWILVKAEGLTAHALVPPTRWDPSWENDGEGRVATICGLLLWKDQTRPAPQAGRCHSCGLAHWRLQRELREGKYRKESARDAAIGGD